MLATCRPEGHSVDFHRCYIIDSSLTGQKMFGALKFKMAYIHKRGVLYTVVVHEKKNENRETSRALTIR